MPGRADGGRRDTGQGSRTDGWEGARRNDREDDTWASGRPGGREDGWTGSGEDGWTGGLPHEASRTAGYRISGPQIPGPRTQGPRQEYLDAFDGPGWPGGPTDTGGAPRIRADGPAGGARTAAASGSGAGVVAGRRRTAAGDDDWYGADSTDAGEGLGDAADGPDGTDAAEDTTGRPSRRGGRGRTFTGIAAAAVTTVLAVVVAGQVAHDRRDGATDAQEGGAHAGTAPPARAPSTPPQAPKPLTYEQKMATFFPLDADLKASGKLSTVPGHDKAPGKGRLYRYRVDVERGMGLDAGLFAEAVQKTVNDERSWAHGGRRTFERISSGRPDFVITLASPGTTASWCAKSGLDTTEDNVSCDSASTQRVMINAYRWARGSKTFGKAIRQYREMLINHEVGHRLGFDHVVCTKPGSLAPVMQQQTKFLTYNGITCKPNAWPFPGK